MPKLVDPVERREHIVGAVLRLVARDGFAGASLRNVAAESGLNIGSVRHYFTSHSELLIFAMTAMVERVTARLVGHVVAAAGWERRPVAERRDLALAALEELLPLDATRRAEVAVFVEFTASARTDPALADLARHAAEGTRELVGRIVARHVAAGGLRPGLDPELETARLWALVDGVSTQAVLQPDLVPPDTCRRVVDLHLRSLEQGAG